MPIGGGVTLPCQLTDAYLAFPCKTASRKLMKQRVADKQVLGEDSTLRFLDIYDGILEQHLYTERQNAEDNLLLRGGLGIGVLARRPRDVGPR